MTYMRLPTVSFLDEMEFIYEQSTGCFYLGDHQDGRTLVARGYSGKGDGLNMPLHQTSIGLGPIPVGMWEILAHIHHARLGPRAFPLKAYPDTQTFGRSGFYIHGDNRNANNSASSGCIILPRVVRDYIGRSGVRRLRVV